MGKKIKMSYKIQKIVIIIVTVHCISLISHISQMPNRKKALSSARMGRVPKIPDRNGKWSGIYKSVKLFLFLSRKIYLKYK